MKLLTNGKQELFEFLISLYTLGIIKRTIESDRIKLRREQARDDGLY